MLAEDKCKTGNKTQVSMLEKDVKGSGSCSRRKREKQSFNNWDSCEDEENAALWVGRVLEWDGFEIYLVELLGKKINGYDGNIESKDAVIKTFQKQIWMDGVRNLVTL